MVLVGGFLVHLSLGTIYTYGNLAPYIVSYIRVRSEPSTLRYTDATSVFACQLAGQGLSMIFGGLLEKKFGPRLVTLFGGWFMSIGVLLSYFSIQYSFYLLLLTYGLMFGIGVGIAYIGPISCAMKWLPKWKGLASGVIVAGFGLSAIIFNTVQTGYINFENISIDEGKYFTNKLLLDRVPYIFLISGGTFAVLQLIGSIFLVNPPPESSQHRDYTPVPNNDNDLTRTTDSEDDITLHKQDNVTASIQKEYSKKDQSSDLEESTKLYDHRNSRSPSLAASDLEQSTVAWSSNLIYNVTPGQILKKPNFYILWIMFFCAGTSVAFISPLYKSFGLLNDISSDDRFLTIAGSVSSIFNFLGRLLWGMMADVTSYKLAFVLQGALASCLMLTFYATGAVGEVMFFFYVCGIFFCIGGYFSLFPTAIARSFGQRNVSINYGMLFTSQIVGGVVAAFISHILVDVIDWYGMFFVISAFNIVEFILAICYRHKRYIRLRHPDDLHEDATRIESSIRFPENDMITDNAN